MEGLEGLELERLLEVEERRGHLVERRLVLPLRLLQEGQVLALDPLVLLR